MLSRRKWLLPMLAAVAVVCFFASVPTLSAKDKASTKAAKMEKQEEKKEVKQEKEYGTISEYASDLYASDPEFRDEVDRAYQDLQRQHALLAYHVNTSFKVNLVTTEGDYFGLDPVLYNDPRVQDYVDRIGQMLVPENSEKLYAFRVVSNPVPSARALSTGTIYISTGLISLTDNEAQLSYILSHELAHVYKDHWKTRVMVERAVPRYESHLAKKRAITGALVGAGLGAAIGGAAGQSAAAASQGLAMGVATGLAASAVLSGFEARKMNVDWTLPQEDEADAFALRNALDHNYDVNEVPRLYATLKGTLHADSRVSLGFVADGRRIDTRTKYVTAQLATTYKTDYEKKLKAEQLLGTSPDYQLMMAELKRDNGIMALQFDMLDMAKKNLHQAVGLRSDDALALFYVGKIDKLIARTPEQRREAEENTLHAIKLDENRHALPEAELQEALLLMEKTDSASQTEAVVALKSYINSYQAKQVAEWKYFNALPPNMVILYDYLRLLGEPNWKPQYPELQRVLTADFGNGGTNAALGPIVASTGAATLPATVPAAPAPKSTSPRK